MTARRLLAEGKTSRHRTAGSMAHLPADEYIAFSVMNTVPAARNLNAVPD